MADKTHIEWTDATWNPVTGCSVVSPGCTNCYAMRLAGTRLRHHPSRAGLTTPAKAGPVWNGEVRLNAGWLDQPLRWKTPRRIFVCAHGDLFHESVPDAWIDQVFAVMALAPQHTFQVLTKRAARMKAWFDERWQGTPAQRIDFLDGTFLDVPAGGETGRHSRVYEQCEPFLQNFGLADTTKDSLWSEDGSCKAMQWKWPLPNVHLGVSVEDQPRADERIPILLDTPAAVRWISAEPLLGAVDLTSIKAPRYADEPVDELDIDWRFDALEVGDYYWFAGENGQPGDGSDGPYRETRIDWVVAGGESGPGARPMHPDWARSLRDQCAKATLHGDDAPVPFLFKQWGEYVPCQTEDDGERLVTAPDGADSPRFEDPRRAPIVTQHGQEFWQIGKKAAGRTLDGVTHDAFPEARA